MEKVRKNGLTKAQLLLRRKVIISEIKRIASKLNKPIITQFDFVTNADLDFPRHAFIKVFGGFNNAIEAAGLKKPDTDFFTKRNELKNIYKNISIKYGNELCIKYIVQETGKGSTSAYRQITTYFGGLFSLCKLLKCRYKSDSTVAQRMFEVYDEKKDTPLITKENFSKRMLEIAKDHENSLSVNILMKDTYYTYATTMVYSNLFFGGFKKMSEELGIIWVEGNRGIDQKELDILKDLRDVYKANDNKISRALYSKKGRHSLEAVEDYFGSFGRACLEVNIRTEAMKE